ncbi:hypothetical protein D9611_002872 [Ephemerocybe angulata]|uniref:Uncharacterized protein n=1 Tax=Ephemerocybe angulata TaxID=980116 RepID=A0A8H5C9X4_9AGAR|nr:hypothetical protein D9611_002872 [Tulosesus angulatus]
MGDRQPGSFSGNPQQPYYHQPTPGASTSGAQQAPYYQNQVADQYYQSMNLHGYSGGHPAMPQPASYHTSYHTATNSRPYTFGQGIGPGLPQPQGMSNPAPSQYQNAPNWGNSSLYQSSSQGQSYGPVSYFAGDRNAWQSHSQGPVGSGGIGQYAPPHTPYYAPGQWNQANYHQGPSYRPTLTLATNMHAPVARLASSAANTPDSLNAASPFSPYPSVGTPATTASGHPSPQIYASSSRLPPHTPTKQVTPEELEAAKGKLTELRDMDKKESNSFIYFKSDFVAKEKQKQEEMPAHELTLYLEEQRASGLVLDGQCYAREAKKAWKKLPTEEQAVWAKLAEEAQKTTLEAKKAKAQEEGIAYVPFAKFETDQAMPTLAHFEAVMNALSNRTPEEVYQLEMLIQDAWERVREKACIKAALQAIRDNEEVKKELELTEQGKELMIELDRRRDARMTANRKRARSSAGTSGPPAKKGRKRAPMPAIAEEPGPEFPTQEGAVAGPSSVIFQPPSVPLSEHEIELAIPSNELESSPVASEHVERAEAATNTTVDVPSPASVTGEEDVPTAVSITREENAVPVSEDAATATVAVDTSDAGRAATDDAQEEAQSGTGLPQNEIEAQAGLLTAAIPIVALTATGAESAQVEPDALNAGDQVFPAVQPIQEPEALPQDVQDTEVAPAIVQAPSFKRRVRKNAATRPKTPRKGKPLPERKDTERTDAVAQPEELAPSATPQDQPIAQPIAVSLAEIEGFNKYKPILLAKSNSPASRKSRTIALALDKEVEEAVRASWIGTSAVLSAPATPEPEDRDPLAKFFNFDV